MKLTELSIRMTQRKPHRRIQTSSEYLSRSILEQCCWPEEKQKLLKEERGKLLVSPLPDSQIALL
jgi:hypothetical protein